MLCVLVVIIFTISVELNTFEKTYLKSNNETIYFLANF